jgi:predicted cupin superfamily sugar epimerase
MKTADYWINHLSLSQHPEGGYYRETYRSTEVVSSSALPTRFGENRNYSTTIYFLLPSNNRSLFHRIKSDEIWYYHAGSSLTIYVLDQNGVREHRLGPDIEKGETLQAIIPANTWFGALVSEKDSYTLSSCSVSPGFDFNDFELAEQSMLLRDFPYQSEIIERLTKH